MFLLTGQSFYSSYVLSTMRIEDHLMLTSPGCMCVDDYYIFGNLSSWLLNCFKKLSLIQSVKESLVFRQRF